MGRKGEFSIKGRNQRDVNSRPMFVSFSGLVSLPANDLVFVSLFVQPIPYWLYKLHGLNLSYTCEICGNYTYRGPKVFQRHFAVSGCVVKRFFWF